MYDKKIAVIRERTTTLVSHLDEWRFRSGRYHGPGEYTEMEPGRTIRVGDSWGGKDVTAWFARRVAVPDGYEEHTVYLDIVVGGEALVRIDGVPYHGLDPNRSLVPLTLGVNRGRSAFEIEIEAYARFTPEEYFAFLREDGLPYPFQRADLVLVNHPVKDYHHRVAIAHQAAMHTPNAEAREFLMQAVGRSLHAVEFTRKDEATFGESARAADQILADALAECEDYRIPARFATVFHSHIDIVWLWRFNETIRKCARTFSTVLRLMEEYPEFVFTQSQPVLYDAVKRWFPGIYEQVKSRIAEGRWEPVGGMWVEADGNIPSGESYVRQLLYGKAFFLREFGVEPRVEWTPDVFGYTASLPQILKRAGIDYFMTTKITWNETNTFPHTSFWWEGIDGSRILVHIPTTSYNGTTSPKSLLDHWSRYSQKQAHPELMYLAGHGDGGGGPTRGMIENLRRLSDVPSLPRCTVSTAHRFFERLAARGDRLPIWKDELYLELCRGTYTSQADTKRRNRSCELLYRDAEILAAIAAGCGLPYPKESFETGWKRILFNQFHDIIPGSSITEAYVDSTELYREAQELGETIRSRSIKHILATGDAGSGPGTVTVFNTLAWDRVGIARVPLVPGESDPRGVAVGAESDPCPSRVAADGATPVLEFLAEVPAMGYRTFRIETRGSSSGTARSPERRLTPNPDGSIAIETSFYRATIDARGHFTSLVDAPAGRIVIDPRMPGNVLECFEDFPAQYEAWDIDLSYQDKSWPVEEMVEPVSAVEDELGIEVRVAKRFRRSEIRQRIRFHRHARGIEFDCSARWYEKQVLLKVAFPVEVHARTATYDIAYGNIQRPTHWNTSWDKARFEVPGHKWADLSETGYGVSILSADKYGFDILDSRMRLTLIKCAVWPDPLADVGEHRFRFGLYPHLGSWTEANTVRAAYELNVPLVAAAGSKGTGHGPGTGAATVAARSFYRCRCDHVVLEVVKRAEDENGTILRLYECHNRRGPVTVEVPFASFAVEETDLLERPLSPAAPRPGSDGSSFAFEVKPYEIRTFRLTSPCRSGSTTEACSEDSRGCGPAGAGATLPA